MDMVCDEGLAQRVWELLNGRPGYIEKKMVGGMGFMLSGNMAPGVIETDLITRVGPDGYQRALHRDDPGLWAA